MNLGTENYNVLTRDFFTLRRAVIFLTVRARIIYLPFLLAEYDWFRLKHCTSCLVSLIVLIKYDVSSVKEIKGR